MTFNPNNADEETVVVQLFDEQSSYSVVFDDNGYVAYAYLLKAGNVVGDVWLYNHGEAPVTPEWQDPEKAPFANPAAYASAESPLIVGDATDVSFKWQHNDGVDLLFVDVYVKGELYGKIAPGSQPGWSKLASKDGPLAKKM